LPTAVMTASTFQPQYHFEVTGN